MIGREKLKEIDHMIEKGKTDEEIINKLGVSKEDIKTERWIIDVFKKNRGESK